ncbi:heme NO-binding domain-containing protein [Roseibacterium sp. SDUM158017]|uniref:heme NO-binding domain-containing protein n=1 Tax=Roseicyclus salinarum TaxID=3036773 RepID=UPI002415725A|nr:heme NO-binding domain-containing protein [Roseibacterium sp. SDUM158017]MDG4648604.1 heme NO-binding domain-containing protein [Roseibacterium sp. SDUM158017]
MINCALQGFLLANYGPAVWREVQDIARLPADGFEAMERYDDALTLACFEAALQVLEKHPNTLLEDIGTHIVIHPDLEPLRRLLRFGGATFVEFLQSLEEMPDRARMAIPELELPEIRLWQTDTGDCVVGARWPLPGIAPLLSGALRAMADDYGALVFLRLGGIADGEERLLVQVFDTAFSEGRSFSLGQAGA